MYRVLAAKGNTDKVRGIAGLRSPLVGRERDYEAVAGALRRLREGQAES